MVEIVAEFTTNHCGNLNLLLRMVDCAAGAGADSIKMQKKDVDTYYTKKKLAAPFPSPYGKTYRHYRTMFEFEELADWDRFGARCRERGVPWFCTVQDTPSLAMMVDYHPWRLKVASSNARNAPFLRETARLLPSESELVISVAGSTLEEIEATLNLFPKQRRIWLLHCVAEYPCKTTRLRLGNIVELKHRFGDDRIRIGYSGHETGFYPTLAAVELGAEMVERHFCVSRRSFVHHVECSLEPDEFAGMARLIRHGGARVTLPQQAYEMQFGMSHCERAFLVHQSYGQQYLGTHSVFGGEETG